PGSGLDGLQLLESVADADQERGCRALFAVQEGEAGVVETAAKTEPVAAPVETQQRHQYQVQQLRWQDLVPGSGLGNAITVGKNVLAGVPGREAQLATCADHGQVELL